MSEPTTTTPPAPKEQAPKVPPRVPLRQRVEWSWRHGPILAPLQAGLGAANTAMVGSLTDVNPWWGAGAGLGMSIAATIAARHQRLSAGGTFYRAACWLGAGAWTTWAIGSTPWQGNTLFTLAAASAAAGLAAPWVAQHEQNVVVQRLEKQAARARVETAVEWEARLTRVCQVKWSDPRPQDEGVLGIETWPREIGMTLQVQLPPGWSYEQLRPYESQLAADARIPLGCDVEVRPGKDRSIAIIRVEIVDVSEAEIWYPDGAEGVSPLTITEPLCPALQRGGVDYPINFLDDPMLLVGQRGSGKTNAIQVLNALLLRCPDALIWHIDLNGAGMSRPWMAPWLKGKIQAPVVDWVAATLDEAILMLTVAVEIAKARKTIYAEHMDEHDDDKIHVSPQLPEIVIVLDEGAEGLATSRGNATFAKKFAELISIARAARVNLVLSTLRATGDIVSMEIQAQIGSKAFMRPGPDSAHEMAQLFGWHQGSISEIAKPGTAAIRTNDAPNVTRARFFRMRPATDIPRVVAGVAGLRPALDRPSIDAITAAGIPAHIYQDRHDRYRTWYADQGGKTANYTNEEDENTMPDDPPRSGDIPTSDLTAVAAELEATNKILRALREEAEAQDREVSDDIPGIDDRNQAPVDDAFRGLVGELTVHGEGDDVSLADSDRRDWFTAFLREAGSRGVAVADLARRFEDAGVANPPSKATLNRWLLDAGWTATGKGPDTRWMPPSA